MFIHFLTNLIFPPTCVACRKNIGDGVVCTACLRSITIRDGVELAHHPDATYTLGAATDYANPVVASLIHHLKFRAIRGAAEPLAACITEYLNHHADYPLPHDTLVVPIPLSKQRRRARGYNQSDLIAHRVANDFGLVFAPDVLVRVKNAKPQSTTTSVTERRTNIHGAYAVADSASSALERGKRLADATILLIDDVSTSGATFLEAAMTLKAAGAGDILAVAAAKA